MGYRFAVLVLALFSGIKFPILCYGEVSPRVKGSFSDVGVEKCDMVLKAVKMMSGVERSGSSNEPTAITDVVIIVSDGVFETQNNNCPNAWTHLSAQSFLFISLRSCSGLPHFNWSRPSGYGQAWILISCDETQTLKIVEHALLTASENVNSPNIMLLVQKFYPEQQVEMKSLSGLMRFAVAEFWAQGETNIYLQYRPTSKLEWSQEALCQSICGGVPEFDSLEGSVANNVLFSERRLSNLHKGNLRVAGVMDSTYSYDTNITREPGGSYKFQDSFAVEVLRGLEYTMNFTVVPKVTNAWGHLNNKTWQGMIALLLNDEADLAISSTADRPFRREVVHFNMPTNEIRLSAFFRRPNSISTSRALLAPFTTTFWFGIIIWLIVASISLILLKSVIGRMKMDDGLKTESFWSLMDCFQWSLSTVCLQGFYNYPSNISARIIIAVASLSGVLFYGAYAGTLISFLSVVIEPITNLGQLVATDYAFSVVDEPLALKFLEESPSDLDQAIYRRRRDLKYKTMAEAKHSLNKGSFVFLVDHMSGFDSLKQNFNNEEACRMIDMVIPYGQQKQGSMVNKNSTIKRVIDYQILRMFEYGLIKRWTKVYLQRKPNCNTPHVYEGVRFNSVYLAFACLAIMFCIAISIFLIETSVHAKTKLSTSGFCKNTYLYLKWTFHRK